jgi:hypothetical protein
MQISAMILLLAALLLDGCGACGEDKLAETGSPGNRYVATTFRRGCGATTGFLYHVNIRIVTWKDDKTLHVSCDGCPKDRKPTMESSWKDVSISYELH